MACPPLIAFTATVLLALLSRPSEVQQIPDPTGIPVNNLVDFNNAEEVFATKFNQAVARHSAFVWKGITKHKIALVKYAGIIVVSLAGAWKVGNLLGGYNKTLATETDRFNTNFNSSATAFIKVVENKTTAFIKVVENKTAAFEHIAQNVTGMIGNKTELFLATTSSFLTEFKTFNANFNSNFTLFTWSFVALVVVIIFDRVSALDSAAHLRLRCPFACVRNIRPDTCAL